MTYYPITTCPLHTITAIHISELNYSFPCIKSPHRQFELQRYTFSADKPIKLLAGRGVNRPVPTGEQIVLSLVDGYLFAILEISSGIYVHSPRLRTNGRAKINMDSGTITPMTLDEIGKTLVGSSRIIFTNYNAARVSRSDI